MCVIQARSSIAVEFKCTDPELEITGGVADANAVLERRLRGDSLKSKSLQIVTQSRAWVGVIIIQSEPKRKRFAVVYSETASGDAWMDATCWRYIIASAMSRSMA